MKQETKQVPASASHDGGDLKLNDEDINTVLAALVMAKARYNTKDNGGIFFDFTFPNEKAQNDYAQNFEIVENRIREQLPENPTA